MRRGLCGRMCGRRRHRGRPLAMAAATVALYNWGQRYAVPVLPVLVTSPPSHPHRTGEQKADEFFYEPPSKWPSRSRAHPNYNKWRLKIMHRHKQRSPPLPTPPPPPPPPPQARRTVSCLRPALPPALSPLASLTLSTGRSSSRLLSGGHSWMRATGASRTRALVKPYSAVQYRQASGSHWRGSCCRSLPQRTKVQSHRS